KPSSVIDGPENRSYLQLTAVTRAGIDMPQLQGPAQATGGLRNWSIIRSAERFRLGREPAANDFPEQAHPWLSGAVERSINTQQQPTSRRQTTPCTRAASAPYGPVSPAFRFSGAIRRQ